MDTKNTKPAAKLAMVRTMVDGKPAVMMTLVDSYKLPASTAELVKSLGWKSGTAGNFQITCTTTAEIDAARNPLRGLVA